MIETSTGWALCTSAPVRDENDQLAGVLIVGTNLDNLLSLIKSQALADIIVLKPEHGLIATTFIEPEEGFAILESTLQNLTQRDLTVTKEITLYERRYQVIHSPLVARNQPMGIIGVALPSNYLVSTEATNRNTFALLFSVGTIGIILIGYFLSQSIAHPILKLSNLSKEVAAGNLNQHVDIERTDEIGDLAKAFDQMTFNLRERTKETARLYAESLQRNQELAVMNEQLKSTQAQLIQSEKLAAIGQLTAGIVHDIKSPLMVIMGLTELIEEEEKLSEEGFHQLSIMRESAKKANLIIQDLLKFSRQSQPDMQYSDMRKTVEAALRLTDYLTRKAKVQVITELPETPLNMTYDPQQIEQVLINLISNAVYAMPEGGSLHIILRLHDNIAAIAVQDTGSGISQEIKNRIFDPFFTTKPEGQGTGLGLAVSYGIIACHNGKIEVESDLGKGTTFTLLIPINHSQAECEVNNHD